MGTQRCTFRSRAERWKLQKTIKSQDTRVYWDGMECIITFRCALALQYDISIFKAHNKARLSYFHGGGGGSSSEKIFASPGCVASKLRKRRALFVDYAKVRNFRVADFFCAFAQKCGMSSACNRKLYSHSFRFCFVFAQRACIASHVAFVPGQ